MLPEMADVIYPVFKVYWETGKSDDDLIWYY